MKKIIVILLVTGVSVIGADFNIPAHYAGPQDSVFLVWKQMDGTLVDSVKYDMSGGDRWDFDTTLTGLSDGIAYMITLLNYSPGEDSAASWSFVRGIQPTPAGDGTANLIFHAVDTTGTDAGIGKVRVTVNNAGGVAVAMLETSASGYDTATLVVGDAYTYTAYGPPGYVWTSGTIASMSAGTDTIIGYNYLPGASPASTPGLNRIYGWITNANGDSLYGADVIAYRDECATAVDSGSNVIISSENVPVTTNTSGYFYIDLVDSDEYNKEKCGWYTIKATYSGVDVFETRRLWITGPFNIADSIGARP